jgi:hypothetical protein
MSVMFTHYFNLTKQQVFVQVNEKNFFNQQPSNKFALLDWNESDDILLIWSTYTVGDGGEHCNVEKGKAGCVFMPCGGPKHHDIIMHVNNINLPFVLNTIESRCDDGNDCLDFSGELTCTVEEFVTTSCDRKLYFDSFTVTTLLDNGSDDELTSDSPNKKVVDESLLSSRTYNVDEFDVMQIMVVPRKISNDSVERNAKRPKH